MSSYHNLEELLIDQLRGVYDAENQLVNILPAFVAAATDVELKQAFNEHLQETREQVYRLREIFQIMGLPAEGRTCRGMAGLIREAADVLEAHGDADVIDAALIAAAQRIEHNEIASYGTMRAFARRLGHKDVVTLLTMNETEEADTDKKLTKLAEGGLLHRSINKEAVKT